MSAPMPGRFPHELHPTILKARHDIHVLVAQTIAVVTGIIAACLLVWAAVAAWRGWI